MLQVADIRNGGYLLGQLEEIFCHESTNNFHQKDVSGFITFRSPRREPTHRSFPSGDQEPLHHSLLGWLSAAGGPPSSVHSLSEIIMTILYPDCKRWDARAAAIWCR